MTYFIRVPERLTEYEWLRDNGLDFKALLLWCHLFYCCSRNGESWFTVGETLKLVGTGRSVKKVNEIIMAMERFKYDGLIDYDEDLTKVSDDRHVTVRINEIFFKGNWKFVQMPVESFRKIRKCEKEIPGDVMIAVYLHVLKNTLDDGWCYLSKERIDRELKLRNGTSSKCLEILAKEKLLRKKVIKNSVTGKKQFLYKKTEN